MSASRGASRRWLQQQLSDAAVRRDDRRGRVAHAGAGGRRRAAGDRAAAPPPPPRMPRLPPPTRGSRRRTGIVIGSLGVTSLAASGVTGAMTIQRKGTVKDDCPEQRCRTSAGIDAASQARSGRSRGPRARSLRRDTAVRPADSRPSRGAARGQFPTRKCMMSPSRGAYSLPSIASLPAVRHLASPPSLTKSSHQMTSARMKPFSKSV